MRNAILILALIIPNLSFAQEGNDEKYYPEYIRDFQVDIVIVNKGLVSNTASDNLINTGVTKLVFTPFNISLYPIKNWGIGFKFSFENFEKNASSINNLNNYAADKFGSNYFFQPLNSDNFPSNDAHTFNYVVGIRYRIIKEKYTIITSLNYGGTDVKTDSYSIRLKEKGGNEIVYYNLSQAKTENGVNGFSYKNVEAGIQLGYKLNSFLKLTSNFNYSVGFSKYSFKESMQFSLSGNYSESITNYKQTISSLRMGIGLQIIIGNDLYYGK